MAAVAVLSDAGSQASAAPRPAAARTPAPVTSAAGMQSASPSATRPAPVPTPTATATTATTTATASTATGTDTGVSWLPRASAHESIGTGTASGVGTANDQRRSAKNMVTSHLVLDTPPQAPLVRQSSQDLPPMASTSSRSPPVKSTTATQTAAEASTNTEPPTPDAWIDSSSVRSSRPGSATLRPLNRPQSTSLGIQVEGAAQPPKTAPTSKAPRRLKRTSSAKSLNRSASGRSADSGRADPFAGVIAAFRWRRDFTSQTVSSSLKRSKSDYQLVEMSHGRQYVADMEAPPSPTASVWARAAGEAVARNRTSDSRRTLRGSPSHERLSSRIGVNPHSRQLGTPMRKSKSTPFLPGSAVSPHHLPPLAAMHKGHAM